MLTKFFLDNLRFNTDKIFEGLSQEELGMLTGSGVTHVYKKCEIIFREGGIPTGIFYLESGKVKKYKATAKGGEQIFYICSAGELIGYHALLSEEYYPDSAATIEESRISFIPKDNFLSVLHNSTILSNRLLKALAHEFSVFINSLANLGTKTARERLAWNLLLLDEKYKEPKKNNAPGEINMSRGDLANIVGTAKETVVRLLQEFRGEGFIETTVKSIRITNRKEIIKAANLMGNQKSDL